MSSSDYVNDKYTTRQSSYTDNTQARAVNRFANSFQKSYSGASSPMVNMDDTATTPSFSENAQTPTAGFSRMTSCRLSVADFSETSSTRAATPPPVNSVNVSLNREICSQSTSCAQLINLAVSKGHVFNAVNWATCLHRLAKLFPTEAKNHRTVVARFLSQAHDVLLSSGEGAKFQPQHLATLLWAMAKLSIVDTGFVEDLVQRAMDVAEALKAQDMANMAWSLAKMGIVHAKMFGTICQRIASSKSHGIIAQFKPMEIASTTWAFGTVGAKGMGVSDIAPVIEALVSECLTRDLRDFSPQALANVLWALAKLNYPHGELFGAFGNHVVDAHRLREFKPQEIANVVWAMHSVGLSHDRLFTEIVSSKAVNWTVFDPHALATVCGGMMAHCDLGFALTVAGRVLASKLKNGYSTSHCGVLLCELSEFLANPTVAAAASVLTEKILCEVSTLNACVDVHTVKGLLQTLPDAVRVTELLARASLVDAEYGGKAHQVRSAEFVLKRLAMNSGCLANQQLGKNLLLQMGSGNARLMASATKLGLVQDPEVVGRMETWEMEDFDGVVGTVITALPLSLMRHVLTQAIPCIKQLGVEQVSMLATAANRLDSSSAANSVSCDSVALALMAAVLSDVLCGRPAIYFGDLESLSVLLYATSELVARHSESCPLDPHVKTLFSLTVSVLQRTNSTNKSTNNSTNNLSTVSLAGLARLVASGYSLGSDCYKTLIAQAASTTLLAQCCQSGPGGLKLLRENLDSFALFCKVISAYVASGHLPGSWVVSLDPLTGADRSDSASSLEGALCLSVALGNVGAVDSQKEVIGNWVLPLMGGPLGADDLPFFTLLASPQLGRQERLRSISDLLSQCHNFRLD